MLMETTSRDVTSTSTFIHLANVKQLVHHPIGVLDIFTVLMSTCVVFYQLHNYSARVQMAFIWKITMAGTQWRKLWMILLNQFIVIMCATEKSKVSITKFLTDCIVAH